MWVYNFEEELLKISQLLEEFPFISFDTEFPGTVFQDAPNGPKDSRQYLYLKRNVDTLKLIQLGITLSDDKGRMPSPISTWQFNFDYDYNLEAKDDKSIHMLINSGIDFNMLKLHGISQRYFGEKVIQSGLVLNPSLTWICFHGCFDMAYFLKVLMMEPLPQKKHNFHLLINQFFPKLLDIKSFVYNQIRFDGGLQRIGEYLGVVREGDMHQAGSDSMFTTQVFFAMFNNLENETDKRELKTCMDQFNHEIYGLTNEQAHRFVSNVESMQQTTREQMHEM